MTERYAEKRAARTYARENGVPYRAALQVIRGRHADVGDALYTQRLLIEAVEGCGIRHWARIDDWDGVGSLAITDLGGEMYRLTADELTPMLSAYRGVGTIERPLDIDGYLADEIIQSTLFGGIIYRSEVRRRPIMAA